MAKQATKKKQAVKGKKSKFSAHSQELRQELRDFDQGGANQNRYALVGLIALDYSLEFEWDGTDGFTGQRVGSLNGDRAKEIQNFLEDGGFHRYSVSYIGKTWRALTSSDFLKGTVKNSCETGEALEFDEKLLRTAIREGIIDVDIKTKVVTSRNGKVKGKNTPTDPKFITNKVAFTKAEKHLVKKLNALYAYAKKNKWAHRSVLVGRVK